MWKRIKALFAVRGIERRMRVAFTSIVLLLVFAGATSLLELERVSHDTEQILVASEQSVDVAGHMLAALSDHNDAIIYMAVVGDTSVRYREALRGSMLQLDATCERANELMPAVEHDGLNDTLAMYVERLNTLAEEYLEGRVYENVIRRRVSDSLATNLSTRSWYVDEYKVAYIDLSRQISRYMTDSQSVLSPKVNHLSHTARRSVTPVFISLLVMFIVVMMLYYFLKKLYVKPILRINRSLGDYLSYKVPFDESIACGDEIGQLRDRIDTLITKSNK